MKYCIMKAAARLRQSRKQFGLLAIQAILGTALLFYSANALLQGQSSLQTARQTIQGQTVEVSYSLANDSLGTDFPVTQDDLRFLEMSYAQQANFLYAAFSPQTMALSAEKGEFLSAYCLFLNESYFKELFGVSPKQNTAYLGENLYTILSEQTADDTQMLYMTQPPIAQFETSTVVVAGGDAFPYVQMPLSQTTMIAHPAAYAQAEDYISLADCIILPFECLAAVQALPQREGSQAALKMCYRDTASENIAPDVLAVLSQRHVEYIYSVEDRYLAMEQAVQETGTNTKLLLLTALGLLLSLLLSTAGILSILLVRRKQQLAVCIAFGATRGAVLCEAACEILMVVAPAAALGVALGWFLCLAADIAIAGVTLLCAPLLVAIALALCLVLTGSGAGFRCPSRLMRII